MADFEAIYSTPSANAIARFVSQHYALPQPVTCRLLSRAFNDVFLVVSADGERFVFRLSHHRARGPADVRTETDFLAHLDRSGVPVAAAVATRDGALFLSGTFFEGPREGVLFRALGGRNADLASTPDARAQGVTLAKMHNAAAGFRAEKPLYKLDLEQLLHRRLGWIQELRRATGAKVVTEFDSIAARAAKGIATLDDLTWTYCHGDCHGSNARILDDGTAAFFDFDECGPGYLAYDLAVFLWAKVTFGRSFYAAWDAFIDGYRTIRPISATDLEGAHIFVIVRHICFLGEFSSRAREWGSENVSDVADGQLEFLEAWERDRLANRLL